MDSVILAWETTLELDNYGFEVERSVQNNGIWEDIGFVEGSGNSFNKQWYAFIDNNINHLYSSYIYRLKQLDYKGNYRYLGELNVGVNFTGIIDLHHSPLSYELSQNYPNPFNPTTRIGFQIPKTGFVSLKIFDLLGKEVAGLVNEEKQAGNYEVTWNAAGFSSGLYFYQLRAGNYFITKKMVIVK